MKAPILCYLITWIWIIAMFITANYNPDKWYWLFCAGFATASVLASFIFLSIEAQTHESKFK